MKRTIISIALLVCSVFSAAAILITGSNCIQVPASWMALNLIKWLPDIGLWIPLVISTVFIGISLVMLFIEYIKSFKDK